jgi:hypothetical protein
MKYVGIDLHKQTIVLCVVNKDRTVLNRQRFLYSNVGNGRPGDRGLGRTVGA